MSYLLAIDQGTTGTTVLCLDTDGELRGRGYHEHRQYYPRAGWVEHDPEEILESVEAAAGEALHAAGITAADLTGVGLANQRESVVLWDPETGKAVDRVIVWQCRRTTDECARLRSEGAESLVRSRTGLVLDPYFSAAKIAWLLDAVPGRRSSAARGNLLAGTIDSWLIWRLTGGAIHATDVTNASRTSLMNLSTRDWDPDLLDLFRVPRECLPTICSSAEALAPITGGVLRDAVLCGVAGDQQAALFGHRCCRPGQAKNTYGTGCFLLLHTGPACLIREDGILTTAACGPAGEPEYAWEGSVFIAGAAIQWLRDELGILPDAAASEALARQVPNSGGVIFVPAFTGLGAPHWDPNTRGALLGLTRGSGRPHLARAALDAIALQTVDLVRSMQEGAAPQMAGPLTHLNVDGGATANNLLMQIQADLLGLPVLRARQAETTALGAAYLAGVGAGVWPDADAIPPGPPPDQFQPRLPEADRAALLTRWEQAVRAVRGFTGS